MLSRIAIPCGGKNGQLGGAGLTALVPTGTEAIRVAGHARIHETGELPRVTFKPGTHLPALAEKLAPLRKKVVQDNEDTWTVLCSVGGKIYIHSQRRVGGEWYYIVTLGIPLKPFGDSFGEDTEGVGFVLQLIESLQIGGNDTLQQAQQINWDGEENLRMAFALFDANGDGTLSREELRDALMRQGGTHGGCPFDPADADNLIAEFDVDMDGRFDVEEFIAAFTS